MIAYLAGLFGYVGVVVIVVYLGLIGGMMLVRRNYGS
jgi:hypothetical protein